ncbi:hypothetical protein B0H14DRAFT_715781 [Mycena olivaceomarginata]|nr:hypothetical protein B0H14DRAFT_715781 [Mycena olivaceomarginata]
MQPRFTSQSIASRRSSPRAAQPYLDSRAIPMRFPTTHGVRGGAPTPRCGSADVAAALGSSRQHTAGGVWLGPTRRTHPPIHPAPSLFSLRWGGAQGCAARSSEKAGESSSIFHFLLFLSLQWMFRRILTNDTLAGQHRTQLPLRALHRAFLRLRPHPAHDHRPTASHRQRHHVPLVHLRVQHRPR